MTGCLRNLVEPESFLGEINVSPPHHLLDIIHAGLFLMNTAQTQRADLVCLTAYQLFMGHFNVQILFSCRL